MFTHDPVIRIKNHIFDEFEGIIFGPSVNKHYLIIVRDKLFKYAKYLHPITEKKLIEYDMPERYLGELSIAISNFIIITPATKSACNQCIKAH